MIVYNVTIKIIPEIEKEWMSWLKEVHIPQVMSAGQFTEYKLFHLLEQNETDGITYVVQYIAATMDAYAQYIESSSPLLRQKALDKWGNQFIAFRTVMEVVH